MSLFTSLRSTKACARLLAAHVLGAGLALALAAAPASAQPAAAAGGPFEGLGGAWTGNGTVTLGSGSKERIRCRVNYDVAADSMSFRQNLRCASDSYTFELRSSIRYADGNITGQWTEATRNKSGVISGRAQGNQIEALAETSGFAAFLTVVTRGGRQQVTIRSKSTEVTEVSISLGRGSR